MWTPCAFERKVKYFVTYTRTDGTRETVGPLRGKDEAEGMVSEMNRNHPEMEACVEEWEPVRAYTREKVA